jgi:hypothetical protein
MPCRMPGLLPSVPLAGSWLHQRLVGAAHSHVSSTSPMHTWVAHAYVGFVHPCICAAHAHVDTVRPCICGLPTVCVGATQLTIM